MKSSEYIHMRKNFATQSFEQFTLLLSAPISYFLHNDNVSIAKYKRFICTIGMQ
ncbi:hypothetical protein ABID23_000822 [Bartonella silvatica]|uniref:Uncharacterized protein n=1 Tax=Bartonella silvatica TaxID=357760 RepID=A0ABV2HGP6_9HYPH